MYFIKVKIIECYCFSSKLAFYVEMEYLFAVYTQIILLLHIGNFCHSVINVIMRFMHVSTFK